MAAEIRDAARLSRHILVGRIGQELLCVIGFIPVTFLSDEAYIWMHTTEAASNHKLIVGRHARQVIPRALEAYTKLIGHCLTGASRRWLETLGAEFITDNVFEIRRA